MKSYSTFPINTHLLLDRPTSLINYFINPQMQTYSFAIPFTTVRFALLQSLDRPMLRCGYRVCIWKVLEESLRVFNQKNKNFKRKHLQISLYYADD